MLEVPGRNRPSEMEKGNMGAILKCHNWGLKEAGWAGFGFLCYDGVRQRWENLSFLLGQLRHPQVRGDQPPE